jgi:hypothetical protein
VGFLVLMPLEAVRAASQRHRKTPKTQEMTNIELQL